MSGLVLLEAKLSALKDFKSESKSEATASAPYTQGSSSSESNALESESSTEDTPEIEESEFLKGGSAKDSDEKGGDANKKAPAVKAPAPKKEKSFIGKVIQFIMDRVVDVFNALARGLSYAYEYRKEMINFRDNPPPDIDGDIKRLEEEMEREREAKRTGEKQEEKGGFFSKLFGAFIDVAKSAMGSGVEAEQKAALPAVSQNVPGLGAQNSDIAGLGGVRGVITGLRDNCSGGDKVQESHVAEMEGRKALESTASR